MKKSPLLFVPLCVLLIYIFSCGKEKSSEPNYTAAISTQWEFKEGSNNYNGSVDSAFFQAGVTGVNIGIMGKSSDKTGLILFAIENFDTTAPATYHVDHVDFTYMKNNAVIYQSDTGNFQITITQISATSITGTFSGHVRDGLGAAKQIRDGRFTITLKANVPATPPAAKDSGWVTFWAKSNPNGGGPIKVRLRDKTETISVFSPSAPTDCQTAGTARFKVPVGTYTWAAASNTQDSVKGTVTVTKDACVKTEVVLQQTGPAMGQVEFWAKNSCTEGGSIRVKIEGTEKSITVFTGTEPTECNLTGCATFSLPPGQYTYKAYCGKTDSIQGTVTITANQCIKKQVAFTIAAAKFELTATSCSSASFQGGYYTGVALSTSNTVTLTVNVISPGTYSITTGKSNGISFSGSGTFTTTGVQQITLFGLGTPGNDAMANIPIEIGSSRCTLQIAVTAPPPTSGSWSFTEGGVSYSGVFGNLNSFGDDLVSGKAMILYGKSSADTTFEIVVHFNGSPSQPIPGNYVSEPNSFSINSTEVILYTDLPPNAKYIYYEKCGTCALSNLKITVTISSYDATTKQVTGTFSGNAWNKKGDVVTISSGKFKATL